MSAASKLPTLGSGSGNERFNTEAAAWDSNPFVGAASKHACEALIQRFPSLSKENPTLDVLEIGCGTGLLTFVLAPFARSITAVDASYGMIDVLKRKIEEGKVGNVTGVCVLLEDPEDEMLPPAMDGKEGRKKFDLIISQLVLHHIPDLGGVLRTMLGCLKEGGWVALTDFEDEGPQSKRFHAASRMDGVARDGIRRGEMEVLMRSVGFQNVKVEVGWSMDKRIERWEGEFGSKGRGEEGQGEVRKFSFVVCLGRR